MSNTPVIGSFDANTGFEFAFGAYGSTELVVLADHLEDALEEALEWLDDNAPGILTTIGPDDYERAAKELGVAWQPEEMADADTARVIERAEADMTMVSHTTLKHGNAIPSWEWTVNELSHVEHIEARKAVAAYDQVELLPCPFCGGTEFENLDAARCGGVVMCIKCHAEGPDPDSVGCEDDGFKAWNVRKP